MRVIWTFSGLLTLTVCCLLVPRPLRALDKDTQPLVYDWRPLAGDAVGVWGASQSAVDAHRTLGTTITRKPIRWQDTQPTANTGCTGNEPYVWSGIESDIDAIANDAGLSIVLTLTDRHPCFVNIQNNGKQIDGPPNNMVAYRNWVTAVVQKFYPRVRYFQVSNEVYNFPSNSWGGSLDDYRTLLRVSSAAIREAAPQAKVLAAGFASNLYVNANPPAETGGLCLGLSTLMSHGAIKPCQGLAMLIEEADNWDFLDYHVYRDIGLADDVASWLRRTLQTANLQGKGMMATESGGPDIRDTSYTAERQSWEVAQRPSLTLASGFDRFIWLHLKTPLSSKQTFQNMSLIELVDSSMCVYPGCVKPAFRTYQAFLNLVGRRARGVQRVPINGDPHQTYLYRWDLPSRSVGVAWSWDGTPIDLPPAFQGQTYYDIFGIAAGTTGATLPFTEQEHLFIDRAAIPEVAIPARSLVMTDDSAGGNAGKRRFRLKVRTNQEAAAHRIVPPARGSSGDPRSNGAILTVYNSAGSGEVVSVALAPANWKALGNDTNPRGYRFRDRSRTGPVTRIVVKTDTIRVTAGKDDWLYTLDEPSQGRIAVRLRFGTSVQWCADVPPRAGSVNDRSDHFRGEPKTAAPAACPPVPTG